MKAAIGSIGDDPGVRLALAEVAFDRMLLDVR